MNDLNTFISKNNNVILESKIDKLSEAINRGQQIDEGFFSSLLGGVAGLTAGSAVMKAVCKSLGIEKGLLFDLLTSKVICGVAGVKIANLISK